MKSVRFPNRDIELAGDLHLPAALDADLGADLGKRGRHAAIVCVHPGSSVKEQTAGLYARRLAERGYVALAYDASSSTRARATSCGTRAWRR